MAKYLNSDEIIDLELFINEDKSESEDYKNNRDFQFYCESSDYDKSKEITLLSFWIEKMRKLSKKISIGKFTKAIFILSCLFLITRGAFLNLILPCTSYCCHQSLHVCVCVNGKNKDKWSHVPLHQHHTSPCFHVRLKPRQCMRTLERGQAFESFFSPIKAKPQKPVSADWLLLFPVGCKVAEANWFKRDESGKTAAIIPLTSQTNHSQCFLHDAAAPTRN